MKDKIGIRMASKLIFISLMFFVYVGLAQQTKYSSTWGEQSVQLTLPENPVQQSFDALPTLPLINPGLYDPILLTPVFPVRQVRQPSSLQNINNVNLRVYNSSDKCSSSSNMFASPYKKP